MTIHIIRHGETLFNTESKIRGWKNIPLDKNGINKAHKIGKELSNNNVDVILSSDLIRAKDTAQIISLETKKPVSDITENLRPWDVGEFSGQESNKVGPIMQEYIVDKPDEPLDGGESFNDFKDRFLNYFIDTVNRYQGLDLAMVTHHRNERLLAAWIKEGQKPDFSIDTNEMKIEGIQPGECIVYEI